MENNFSHLSLISTVCVDDLARDGIKVEEFNLAICRTHFRQSTGFGRSVRTEAYRLFPLRASFIISETAKRRC